MGFYHVSPKEFRPGDRVELHPGLDLWMMGAKYGTVTSIGRTLVGVKLDKLPDRIRRIPPSRLQMLPSSV